jgi:hypothetical protein
MTTAPATPTAKPATATATATQKPATTTTTATATPKPATATLSTALNSPSATAATPQQLEYVLARAMAKAFADMGLKTADRTDEVTYLVQTMPAEVCKHLPGIKLDEIPIAINRGILRQFGDFYGLNVATFMHFLTQHYQSRQRAEAVKAAMAQADEPPPAPSPAQQQQMRMDIIKNAFTQYQSTGHYADYGNLVFDSINKMGKIPFSEAREAQMLQQARQNLISKYSRGSVYASERQSLRASLTQILQGQGQNLIIAEAKRIALFELFDYLTEMGMDVEEFLETEG